MLRMDFRLYNRLKCPNTSILGSVFYKQAFMALDFTLEVIPVGHRRARMSNWLIFKINCEIQTNKCLLFHV